MCYSVEMAKWSQLVKQINNQIEIIRYTNKTARHFGELSGDIGYMPKIVAVTIENQKRSVVVSYKPQFFVKSYEMYASYPATLTSHYPMAFFALSIRP